LARYYRKKGLAVSAETSPAEVCGFAEIWDGFPQPFLGREKSSNQLPKFVS
jgi:hypothetical protein